MQKQVADGGVLSVCCDQRVLMEFPAGMMAGEHIVVALRLSMVQTLHLLADGLQMMILSLVVGSN